MIKLGRLMSSFGKRNLVENPKREKSCDSAHVAVRIWKRIEWEDSFALGGCALVQETQVCSRKKDLFFGPRRHMYICVWYLYAMFLDCEEN